MHKSGSSGRSDTDMTRRQIRIMVRVFLKIRPRSEIRVILAGCKTELVGRKKGAARADTRIKRGCKRTGKI